MPKETYLTMYVNRTLKSELQKIAKREGHPNLTEFVCNEIEMLLEGKEPRSKPLPRRAPRGAYLMMWLDADVKRELLRLADADYRMLTDYVDLQLRLLVGSRGERLDVSSVLPARRHASPRSLTTGVRDRIAISLNHEFKAQLEELARREFRSLTNLIEVYLNRVVAGADTGRASPMRRQSRTARLVMRVTPSFKSRLSRWADSEYRSLTDFVEMRLHEIVARCMSRKG